MSAIELKDVFRVHATAEGDAAALQGLSLRVATSVHPTYQTSTDRLSRSARQVMRIAHGSLGRVTM